MPQNPRGWRLATAVLAVSLLPGIASAQSAPGRLKLPTMVASAAAAADWASTYHALSNFELRETNPMLQSFQGEPGKLVTVGAAIDAGSVTAWNLTMGRRYPRVAAAGLWAMAGFRAYLAIHNLRNTTKVDRRGR